MIGQLKAAVETNAAKIGLFITLKEPTREMELEATTAGFYTSPISSKDYPRIQILTIRELLEEGKKPMLPLLILPTYQQTERIPSNMGMTTPCGPTVIRRVLGVIATPEHFRSCHVAAPPALEIARGSAPDEPA